MNDPPLGPRLAGSLDPARWQRVKALFEQAIELPIVDRSSFLDTACSGDADLRDEVEGLLAASEDERPFLDRDLSSSVYEVIAAGHDPNARIGKEVGPYRLLSELGQGGMGSVYLAERADGSFEQQVAVKLLRPGLHPDALLERFALERDILASLNHPHIASLLDGGVGEQGPYIVMEYVVGEAIDSYCDSNRLSTRERLTLFRTVCEAVQFAHKKLIVHRDLKPSNVLVTPDGYPKLLDFGIARLLEADRRTASRPLTQTGLRLMTPEYASPEQIRGERISTATDVYALGVLLYELLTGRRPYDLKGLSPAGVERAVGEATVVRPSSIVAQGERASRRTGPHDATAIGQARRTTPDRLRRMLDGDLDTIVLKAMQKDPDRRYASAAQLGEDIGRYLAQLPVMAQPDSLGYRIRTFTRRNAVAVTASVVVAATLLGGIFATASQAARAEARFQDVRALSNALLFDLHDDIRDLPGSTAVREKLVSRALLYLDLLGQENSGDADLQLELATAFEQVGQIQGDPHYPNLGDLEGAEGSYTRALEIVEDVWRKDTLDGEVTHAFGRMLGRSSVLNSWAGGDQVMKLSGRSIQLLEDLLDRQGQEVAVVHDLARIRSELGWFLIFDGDTEAGLAELATAIAALESIDRGQDLEIRLDLWRAYTYEIDGLNFSNRFDRSLDRLQSVALPHLHRIAATHPNQPRVQYGLHVGYNYLGLLNGHLKQYDDAVEAHEQSLGYAQRLLEFNPANQKGFEAVSRSYAGLGEIHRLRGDYGQALEAFEGASAIRREMYAMNPGNISMGNQLALSDRWACRVVLAAGDYADALDRCVAAAELQERVADADTGGRIYDSNLGSALAYAGDAYRGLAAQARSLDERSSLLAEAIEWYERSYAVLRPYETLDLAWEVRPDSVAAILERLRPAGP